MPSTIDTRGVSCVFLKEFRKNYLATFKSIEAAQICDEIIKPRTEETSGSFLDFLGSRTDSRGVDYVSKANFRVCFGWKSNFIDVIQLLVDHAEKQPVLSYYWIDLFCENFHADAQSQQGQNTRDEKWLRSDVKNHVIEIGRTLVPMPDLRKPLPLCRSWCVFEIMTSAKENVPVSFLSTQKDDEHLVCGLLESIDQFDEIFQGFAFKEERLQNSEVDYADKIYTAIKRQGFENVSSRILVLIKSWIIDICKEECNELLADYDRRETGYKLAKNLAQYLTNLGDLEMGSVLLNKALSIGAKIWPGETEFPCKFSNMLQLGIIQRKLKKYDNAMEYFAKILECFDIVDVPVFDIRRAEVFLQQGIVLKETEEYEDALRVLNEVISKLDRQISEGLEDCVITRVQAYVELADVHTVLEHYAAGSGFYQLVLIILEQEIVANQNDIRIDCLSKVGRIFYVQKHYGDSKTRYEEALKLATINGNDVSNLQSAFNESAFKLRIEMAKEEHKIQRQEKLKTAATRRRRNREKVLQSQ